MSDEGHCAMCHCPNCRAEDYKRPRVVNVFATEMVPDMTCIVVKELYWEGTSDEHRAFLLRIIRRDDVRELTLSHDGLTRLYKGIGNIL